LDVFEITGGCWACPREARGRAVHSTPRPTHLPTQLRGAVPIPHAASLHKLCRPEIGLQVIVAFKP